MKNITTATKIILGVTFLVAALICADIYLTYRDLRGAAEPEAITAADKFAAEVGRLQPGDILSLKTGAFMVETHGTSPSLLIVSGPGPESNVRYRKNRPLDGNRIWYDIASGEEQVTITRKGDPGWEANANWFFLQ